MRKLLGVVLILVLVGAWAVPAGASDFQTGKIVSVEKQEVAPPAGGTDAPPAANRAKQNITIQVADQLYVCRGETAADIDLDWAQGKEVPVMVKGKTMSVKKADGKIVKLAILSTKKAD